MITIICINVVIIGFVIWLRWASKPTKNKIQRQARLTASAIDRDAEEARRQMNEIAGQSWRNILP